MRTLIVVLALLGILVVSGCSESGDNAITGNIVSEVQTQQKAQVQPSCVDACYESSCNGWKFIKCEKQSDGCKDKIEVGLIKGNCGVACLSDADCTSEQKCGINYGCKEPEPIIYSVGEDIAVDELIYKVSRAESFTKMGTSIVEKTTTGKFVKVYLSITNKAKETQEIFTPRFKVIDSQGRKYDRLSDDMLYISDHLGFGKQLQPDLTVSGAIVFELPKDAGGLKLIIRGDWLSTSEVQIELPTIRNVGVDTTLKAEQQKIMDEAVAEGEKMMEDIMSKCNAPFKCSSDCAAFSDVGQKDCPSGQVCCMTEQSEVNAQIDKWQKQADEQVKELMNRCNAPFKCSSYCPEFMGVGQKDCSSGQVCCMT